jgi:hypothetical protein
MQKNDRGDIRPGDRPAGKEGHAICFGLDHLFPLKRIGPRVVIAGHFC